METDKISPIVLKTLTPTDVDLIKKAILELNIPELVQPGLTTNKYLWVRFVGLSKNCWKVYFPVHFLMLLIRLKTSKAPKSKTIKRFFIELARSMIFSVLYAMSMPLSGTYCRFLYNGLKSPWAGTVVATTFATTILFESPGRLSEMSLYVLGQWFNGFSYSLVKRGYVPNIPYLDNLVLGTAFGIISFIYYKIDANETKDKRSKIESAISFILGDNHLKA